MHKKFWIAGIMGTVFVFVYEMLVHGFALMSTYEATASVWRDFGEMESLWWFSLLIQALTAFAMACYMSKRSVHGMEEGACFGSMIGILLAIMQLGTYAFLPLTMALPLIWAFVVWAKMTILGAIIGKLYAK